MLKLKSYEEELENLGNIIKAIKAQVSAFHLFQGDNQQLDALLKNVQLILGKQNCFLEGNEKSAVAAATTTGISSLVYENEAVQSKIERIRIALNAIKLHGAAFRFFADDADASNLRLFLQNLDLIMAKLQPSQSSASVSAHESDMEIGITNSTSFGECKAISESDPEPYIVSTFSGWNWRASADNDSSVASQSVKIEELVSSDSAMISTPPEARKRTPATITVRRFNCSSDTEDEDTAPYCSKIVSHNNKRKLSTVTHPDNNYCECFKSRKRQRAVENGDGETMNTDDSGVMPDDECMKPSPVQQVLATDLVMIKILKHLNVPELKLCRQICSRFNIFSTEALRHQDSCKIKFQYDWNSKMYFLSSSLAGTGTRSGIEHDSSSNKNNNAGHNSLQNFSNLLQTTAGFPCESFGFTGGTLESKDIRDFFCIHGKLVKNLYLDLFCPPVPYPVLVNQKPNDSSSISPVQIEYPSIYSLKTLLVCRLSGLQSLELQNFPRQWNTTYDRLFPEPIGSEIQLKNLKNLKLGGDAPSKVFSDLLKSAINLQTVYSPLNYSLVLKANKFSLIQKLLWRPCLDNIDMFEDLPHSVMSSGRSRSHLQLQCFGICLDRLPPTPGFLNRVSNALMKLVKGSCGTLTEFNIASSLGSLPQLKFPRCENVKLLKVGKFDLPPSVKYPQPFGLSEVYFPRGFQFTSTFPNLTSVRFHLYDLSSVVPWTDCFENHYEELKSVKTVVFENSRFFPSGWLARFANIFPDMEYLEIRANRFKFVKSCEAIWKLKNLKELKFKINLNLHGNCYPALDSAFTGFSKSTCVQLRETSDLVDIPSVEGLRENLSIVDCKDLKIMHVTFLDLSPMTRMEYAPIMTHVTSLFAFHMCHPHLKICFHFKVSNSSNLKKLRNAVNPLLYKYHTET